MTFGEVHILTWVGLFIATLFYEYLSVVCVIAIIKFKSFAVAHISTGINAIGIGCVLLYTSEVNNSIPILAAVWVGNYCAVEFEKRKQAKEINKKNDGLIADGVVPLRDEGSSREGL